jgi:hypothetical protein
MPAHNLRHGGVAFGAACADCDWRLSPKGSEPDGAEIRQYAFERSRFGGVLHERPRYALFDLDAFRAEDNPTPTDDDWLILAQILRTPKLLPPDAKPSDLERALKSVLPSNRDERRGLIQLLAYASLLEDPSHPGYLDSYVFRAQREMPRYRFLDWGYPAIWWRARFGVRADAVQFWFPELSIKGGL